MNKKQLKYEPLKTDRELLAEFLRESNAIEGEYSEEAFEDAALAWDYMVKSHEHTAFPALLLKTHGVLMRRRNPRIAGTLRQVSVMVGGRICPNWAKVPDLLDDWMEAHFDASTEETIKQAHIEFEHIHPFEDGNGRVGRLLMNLQRLKAGLPLLVIHEGDEQYEYYKWFR